MRYENINVDFMRSERMYGCCESHLSSSVISSIAKKMAQSVYFLSCELDHDITLRIQLFVLAVFTAIFYYVVIFLPSQR